MTLYADGSPVGSGTWSGNFTVEPYVCDSQTVTGSYDTYTENFGAIANLGPPSGDGQVTMSGDRYTATFTEPVTDVVVGGAQAAGWPPQAGTLDVEASVHRTCGSRPSDTAPPTIAGNAVPGQTLVVHHGRWTNDPSTYADQWERCDGAGRSCVPIPGGTGTTYRVAAADSGHAIVVAESATNSHGTDGPVLSQPALPAAARGGRGGLVSPVVGKSVVAALVSGVVLVRQPGRRAFRRLTAGESIPLGSTINATTGVLQLTAARDKRGHTEVGRFYAGQFGITQKRLHGSELTVLTLNGPRPEGCTFHGPVAVTARKRPKKRRLWGSASGGFTTGTDDLDRRGRELVAARPSLSHLPLTAGRALASPPARFRTHREESS